MLFVPLVGADTAPRILQQLQDGPASVGEIVETLGIKQANASKPLGILYQAGVLAREKAGNSAIYSIPDADSLRPVRTGLQRAAGRG